MTDDEWLLIDIDGEYASFATGRPDQPNRLDRQARYLTTQFRTATDCIRQYAGEHGIMLTNRNSVLVLSGAISGDSVRIQRCPWIISIRGVGYIVGKPTLALNDAGAKAWADVGRADEGFRRVGGPAGATLPGRGDGHFLALNYQTGLGGSLIATQDGAGVHIELEVGHIGFSPQGEVQHALFRALGGPDRPVGWEQALFAGEMPRPAGSTPLPPIDDQQIAAMLGGFCGDAVLATGAWQGVVLHGRSREALRGASAQAAFNMAFEMRANYRSALRNVPRWTVERQDENLIGALQYIAARRS
jgi:glucokinase